MSLIDKQLRAAKLQREFAIKIDEQAYKSFNGTRQSARNFREGTLDIGKMGFDNTAEERITKEMITDYHKKEQDNIEKRLEGRVKTTLHDTIETELVTPVVTNWAATGAPATTADLMRVGDELNQKVNELTMYKEVMRTVPKKAAELEYYKNKSKFKRLSPEWMELQRPIMQYYADMKQAKAEIPVLEPQVTNLQAQYRQIEENIKLNEQAIIDAKVANKEVAKKYEDVFNEQNKNLYSVKQEPYESEEDYIRRIKQLDDMKYDPTLYKNRAAAENSKELMTNLKQVINDDAKISEIIKLLPSTIHFNINKYWPKFKDTILKIYGTNNKQATAANYAEFIAAIYDTIDTKGSLVTVLTGAEPKPPKPPAPAPPPPPTPPTPSVFDIALSADKKTLMVRNTSIGLTIFIKLTTNDEILFSDTDEEGTYKKFFFATNTTYPKDVFQDVMKTIGLLNATGGKTADFLNLFGAVSTTKYDYYTYLKDDIGLEKTQPVKRNFNHKYPPHDPISVGWGMKSDDVPKHAHFGKNIILLNKLYFQNILSIKDKKMHSVENFPNVKVSDKLTDILYHMCIKNTKPTKEIINSLNATEKKLFDLLLYVSGLGKNIGTNKDENITELKDRLKLVESQIRAGNNNPVVKKEMKEIIQKLYLYKVISHNNGKAYLKQF
jgi:hypothetical protein